MSRFWVGVSLSRRPGIESGSVIGNKQRKLYCTERIVKEPDERGVTAIGTWRMVWQMSECSRTNRKCNVATHQTRLLGIQRHLIYDFCLRLDDNSQVSECDLTLEGIVNTQIDPERFCEAR